MSQDTTTTVGDWVGDNTTSGFTNLLDNATLNGNDTQTLSGGANTILAEETIKIIYLIIGQ